MSYRYTTEWTGTPTQRGGRLGRLLRDILAGLDALHRVRFEAPWKSDASTSPRF